MIAIIFSILISLSLSFSPDVTLPIPKYKTDLANWTTFGKICTELGTRWAPGCLAHQVALLSKSIRSAAHSSIPQTKCIPHKAKISWWNPQLQQQARDTKQSLLHTFKSQMSSTNLINYKRANAIFKKEVLLEKRKSLENCTSRISPLATTKKILG